MQVGNATLQVLFQGGNADVTTDFLRVEMLRHKYFFRVEMLRHKYFFRVEMRRYEYLFRVEMLRYKYFFRVEKLRHKYFCRVEMLRHKYFSVFQGANADVTIFFHGWKSPLRYKYFFRVEMLCYDSSFRMRNAQANALGRQRLKPKAANAQVLSAAALHRHPGLKTVLKALLVYKQACSKGTVQTNPANCYDAKKLAWLKC